MKLHKGTLANILSFNSVYEYSDGYGCGYGAGDGYGHGDTEGYGIGYSTGEGYSADMLDILRYSWIGVEYE